MVAAAAKTIPMMPYNKILTSTAMLSDGNSATNSGDKGRKSLLPVTARTTNSIKKFVMFPHTAEIAKLKTHLYKTSLISFLLSDRFPAPPSTY